MKPFYCPNCGQYMKLKADREFDGRGNIYSICPKCKKPLRLGRRGGGTDFEIRVYKMNEKGEETNGE